MAICKACRRNSDQAICPHCGYQVVVPTMLNEDVEKELNKLADDYLRDLMRNLEVYVVAYAFELSADDELRFKEERELLLFQTSDFTRDQEVWNDQPFGTTEDLNLIVYIELNDNRQKYELTLPIPQKRDEWHIGINLSRDLYLRVMVGEMGNYSPSDPIDLLALSRK